jgi:hypothetical protein
VVVPRSAEAVTVKYPVSPQQGSRGWELRNDRPQHAARVSIERQYSGATGKASLWVPPLLATAAPSSQWGNQSVPAMEPFGIE